MVIAVWVRVPSLAPYQRAADFHLRLPFHYPIQEKTMKLKIKIGIAVCAVLATLLTVVILLKHSISPSPKPLTLDEAKALYTNAQTALHSAQNKVQTITSFEEINYNGSIFSEQLVRTETYNGIGTNNSVIHIDSLLWTTLPTSRTEPSSSDSVRRACSSRRSRRCWLRKRWRV